MSVTFTAAITSDADTQQYRVVCEDGQQIGVYVGYANAHAEGQAHSLVCTHILCQEYGADVDEVHTPDNPEGVNMSNRNASDVLRVLGLLGGGPHPDLCGTMPARRFLDLVGTALAVGVHDPELVEIETSGVEVLGMQFEGRYIDAGREAGYLTRRLTQLRDLAEACVRLGADVTWG